MAISCACTLEELVTCNICSDKYDEDVRKPKFLQCGHTICLYCLQAIRRLDTITCPFCRKCTSKDISDGAKWVLPNNQYALEMLRWTRNVSISVLPTAPVEPAKEEEDEQLMVATVMSSREIKEEEVLNKAMHKMLLDRQKEQEITETAAAVIPHSEPDKEEGWATFVSDISNKTWTNKSAADYDYQEKVGKHGSQVAGLKGFGGKFGVQTDRQDAAVVGFDEGQGHVDTTYEKYQPVIAEKGKASPLKSWFKNLADKNNKSAAIDVPLPSKNAHPMAKIAHQFETQSVPQTDESPIRQLPKSGRKSKDDGWSSVVSEISSKVLNKKSAVNDYQDARLNQTSQAKSRVMPKPVILESPMISPERYSRYSVKRSSLNASETLYTLLGQIFDV